MNLEGSRSESSELEEWLAKSFQTVENLKLNCKIQNKSELLDRLAQTLLDKRRWRAAFEAFPGHISWVSRDLKYLGVNEGLAFSVNLNPDDFIGKEVGFVTSDSPFSRFIRAFMPSEKTDDRQVLEVFSPSNQESRWFSVVARKYDQGDAAVVIGLDVTELRSVQNVVSDLQRKMTHVTRLATLGEVAAGMTHEINNPMTVITTGIYALREELTSRGQLDSVVVEYLNLMDKATRHVGVIIDGARGLSRADVDPPFVNVPLNPIVIDAMALCGEKIKHAKVKVKCNIADDLEVFCQPSNILQVLMNLITNACDALEEFLAPEIPRWIEIDANKLEPKKVIIRVTDAGNGIAQEVRETIFQPFFTTKPPGKGTGLGLSITKSIIDRHHGQIYVDGAAKNTTFVIILNCS